MSKIHNDNIKALFATMNQLHKILTTNTKLDVNDRDALKYAHDILHAFRDHQIDEKAKLKGMN